jgi:hypothetical protein
MWKNFGQQEEATDDNTIWRLRFASWVTETSAAVRNAHCFRRAKLGARKRFGITS